MARIRTIKPEFPQSESMGRVSRDARLTFIMLWTIADDSGRLRGNSRMLASLLFPYDDDARKHIDGWLQELETEGCITRYVIDGDTYLQVNGWAAHQKIDKPSASKIPPAPEGSRILANVRESSSEDQGPRTKDQGEDQGEKAPRKRDAAPVSRPDDVAEQTWGDWLQLRKSKKAPVTATVIDGARAEAVKAGLSLQRFLEVWCVRGSQGLQAEWLRPEERAPARPSLEPAWRAEQRARTQQAAPGVAVGQPAAEFFVDVEARRVEAPALPGVVQ
jgi:hypothetical protein